MTVPYIFGTATQVIPLSQLDTNFATPITLNGQALHLGDTANLVGLTGAPGRNRLINGDFRLSQYTPNAQNVASSNFYIDRWYIAVAHANYLYMSPVTVSSPSASATALGLVVNTSSIPAAADDWVLQQSIESTFMGDFQFGNTFAKSISLSFNFLCGVAGLYGGSITNYAGTRSYVFTFNYTSPNNFQNFVITIPGDQAGTWANTGVGGGMKVIFDLGVGSNFATAAGAWVAGNYQSAPGTTKFISQAVNTTIYITDIQLELAPPGATPANPLATPFDRRPVPQELALCQRYFENLITNSNDRIPGYIQSGQIAECYAPFQVLKRAAPTMNFAPNAAAFSVYSWITSSGYAVNGPLTAVCNLRNADIDLNVGAVMTGVTTASGSIAYSPTGNGIMSVICEI